MKKNFKSFNSDYSEKKSNQKNESSVTESSDKVSIEKMYEQLKNKPENELEAELIKRYKEQKNSGNFSSEQFANATKEIKGYLNEEQQKKLEGIIKLMK